MNGQFADRVCSFHCLDQSLVHATCLFLRSADITRFGISSSTLGRLGLHIAHEINLKFLLAVHAQDHHRILLALLKGAHPNCWSFQYFEGTAFITVARLILPGPCLQVPRTVSRDPEPPGTLSTALFRALATMSLLIDCGLSSFRGTPQRAMSIHSVVASALCRPTAPCNSLTDEVRSHAFRVLFVRYRAFMIATMEHAVSRGGTFLVNFRRDCLDEASFQLAMGQFGLPDDVITEGLLQKLRQVITTIRQFVDSQ